MSEQVKYCLCEDCENCHECGEERSEYTQELTAKIKKLQSELEAANKRVVEMKCCGNCALYGWYCDPYSDGAPERKDSMSCEDWVRSAEDKTKSDREGCENG